MAKQTAATPTEERCITSYPVRSGMKGILYTTITGRDDPAGAVREIDDELYRVCIVNPAKVVGLN